MKSIDRKPFITIFLQKPHGTNPMKLTLFLCFFISISFRITGQATDWTTWYERSGKTETPRYDATIEYCKRLDAASPLIHYTTFGHSEQGRELPLMILDRDGLTDPDSIRRAGRTLLLVQACIHPGESEGKDAGLMLFRDLAIGGGRLYTSGLLDQVTLLFIPIFNADGHERFGPWNRINQNGPREMGWRTNAMNLNLNRDYLKADSREMQAWLKMFNAWDPDFFVDCHTTDGADYQYVLTYLMEIYGSMDAGLTEWAAGTFIPRFEKHMEREGFPVFPYVGFRNWHDPRSGLITEVAPPMLSQGYTALRNRPGLLLETHMLKPYDKRVDATYESLVATMEILSAESAKLKRLLRQADAFACGMEFQGEPFPLRFEVRRDDSTMVKFLGVEYTVDTSELTGGPWFRYSHTPAVFDLPYFSHSGPVKTARLPVAYVLPAGWNTAAMRLKDHGLRMTTIARDTTVKVSAVRLSNPKWQQNPYEGRHPLTGFDQAETEETITLPAGSLLIEVSQPAARIIPHLLEPDGNGSLLYWGFFDAVFEQKEYGESYVMEPLAREMMAADPQLSKEFTDKKASDQAFASNPWAMLNWFYLRSRYGDTRKGLYPVLKIYDRALVQSLRR